MQCGELHTTQTCFSIKEGPQEPDRSMVATCTPKMQLLPTMEDTSAGTRIKPLSKAYKQCRIVYTFG
jgi:hypothetical protein